MGERTESDHDRAAACYATAYFALPHYVFGDPGRVLTDFGKNPDYAAKFFYVMACTAQGREPNEEDVRRITGRSGTLNDDFMYHVVEYPTFARVDLSHLSESELFDAARKVVLAPYFSAIVYDGQGTIEHYFVLGQSPDGATTLRRVTAGANENLGRGSEPSLNAFLALLRSKAGARGSLPPVVAAVTHGAPRAPRKWWQFWRR